MSRMPEPYRLADQILEILTKRTAKKLNEVKRGLTVLGFDELNVLQEMNGLYAWLVGESRIQFAILFGARFREVYRWLNDREPADDMIDTLVAMALMRLLEEPNPVTHYTYMTEVYRKRDRAIEAIMSCPTKAQKQIELQKQIKYVLQQIAWYTDFTSQDAEIEAFKESGISEVQRHEVLDRRTCLKCRDADGEIYPIDKIPPLPHLRCRRWFTKV